MRPRAGPPATWRLTTWPARHGQVVGGRTAGTNIRVSRSRARFFARRDGTSAVAADSRMRAAERLEHAHALDGAASTLTGLLRRVLPSGGWADVLHGVPFGQPVHPALTGLPLGFWTSATVLDFVPGSERGARALIAFGLASTVPTAAAGWADWSALHREQQRVGLVHAASGACASTLFAASLLARGTGRNAAGRVLSIGGLAAAAAGGYLGRHLAYSLGAGTSHAEPVTHLAPLGWHDLCAHLGGPLHQGRLDAGPGGSCIVCPWHGSTFRVADGAVVHGPATARQPAFEVRVSDSGMVQVRPRKPRQGHAE